MTRQRVLLMGWFSFEDMGATAGDLIVRDVVAGWLRAADITFDVGLASPFDGGVHWEDVDPGAYTDVVFACGPFGNGPPVDRALARFNHCRLHGLDLSMLQPLEEWNPFHFLAARDSSAGDHPDLSFAGIPPTVPVVGVVKVHPQPEYGSRGRHDRAHQLIDDVLESVPVAPVEVDTRLDVNASGLRTSREVISVLGRMDAVITTRLHGSVLALAQGVPAVAIDPIAGGAKILRQMRRIGWAEVFEVESATVQGVRAALLRCLDPEARSRAVDCAAAAREEIEGIAQRFLAALAQR